MARQLARATTFALCLALTGCGFLPPTAADRCAQAAIAYSGAEDPVVVGSFDTTVGAIRNLEPLDVQPQRWPDRQPSYPATLCYIDAAIPMAPPPPLNGPPAKPFNRVLVAIVDGQSEMIVAGYREQLPVKAP